MRDEKLKSCPFCGAAAKTQPGIYGYLIWVGCPNQACGLRPSSQFNSEAEAVTAWNTRSEPPADLKAVREALAELERSFGHWSPPTPHQRASLNRLRASLQRKETVDE